MTIFVSRYGCLFLIHGLTFLLSASTLPIVRSLVSSSRHDIYTIHSSSANASFDLPLACAYSNQSKRGDTSLLAVSTEEGKVEIMRTALREAWQPGTILH